MPPYLPFCLCTSIYRETRQVLANVVISQSELLKKYGGVHPSESSSAHRRKIHSAVRQALSQAGSPTLRSLPELQATKPLELPRCVKAFYCPFIFLLICLSLRHSIETAEYIRVAYLSRERFLSLQIHTSICLHIYLYIYLLVDRCFSSTSVWRVSLLLYVSLCIRSNIRLQRVYFCTMMYIHRCPVVASPSQIELYLL